MALLKGRIFYLFGSKNPQNFHGPSIRELAQHFETIGFFRVLTSRCAGVSMARWICASDWLPRVFWPDPKPDAA
jgi:hypothetical protein